jgi:hypothetical protein
MVRGILVEEETTFCALFRLLIAFGGIVAVQISL